MTRYAQPVVLACPRCESPILERRIASLNFLGACRWSDGSPGHWASGIGRLARCPACDSLFWLAQAPRLGVMPREPRIRQWSWLRRTFAHLLGNSKKGFAEEMAFEAIPEEWHWARYIESAKGRDLLWALERGFGANVEDEIYIRTKLWQTGNRPKRGSMSASPMTSDQERENMLRLLDLHRSTPSENWKLLVEAELLRELGRFEEAIALLESTQPTDSEMVQGQLDRARAGDSKVFSIDS